MDNIATALHAPAPYASAPLFDVAGFVDGRAIGLREVLTLVIVSIVLLLDGFDIYVLGKIPPSPSPPD